MSKPTDNTTVRLHQDWPEFDRGADAWDLPAPVSDFAYAVDSAIRNVSAVERYYVSYHGSEWKPDDQVGGTELEMVVVGRLDSGEWVAVEAWNDYTGWGCQDGSDVYVGGDEDDVVYNGLTKDGRSRLGYPERV